METIGKKILTLLFIGLLSLTAVLAYGNGRGRNFQPVVYEVYDDTGIQYQLEQYPVQELTEEEKAGLLLMREEEKLARDVYQALYDQWGMTIFTNIAQSEQTHTNAIKALLEKYQLEDPYQEEQGVFSNQKLQDLYNQLVAQGSSSLTEALKVGATIEDLDINDLQDYLTQTDNEDIHYVYEQLMRGSRNHLRSFTKVLEQYGETYTPQYLNETTYQAIITTAMERGNAQNQAQGKMMQRGQQASMQQHNPQGKMMQQKQGQQQGNAQRNKQQVQSIQQPTQEQSFLRRMFGWLFH